MTRSVPQLLRLLARHHLRTVALWTLPGIVAAFLWTAVLSPPAGLGRPWVVVALLIGFMLADRATLAIDVQRQTWTISPMEIPLVVGLFLVNPLGLLVARVGAGVSLLLDGRRLRGKQLYNVGVFAIEVAVAEFIFSALGARPIGVAASWPGALGAVAGADIAGAAMVALAILLTNGGLSRRRLTSLVVPTVVVGSVSCSIGLIGLIVVHVNRFGGLLLVGVCGVFVIVFRTYGRFLRQHESLGRVYEFSRSVERARSDPRVLDEALAQARDMLNASTAVLCSAQPGEGVAAVLTAESDGSVRTEVLPADEAFDALRTATMGSRRTRRFVEREVAGTPLAAALAARGAKEVIAVALRAADRVLGTFELFDRQGQLSSFTADDLTLLETLAAHLTASVENQQLLDRLRHAAYHDRLTGLPNRGRLAQVLDEAIGVAPPDGQQVVLVQLDVNRFKEINDSLGHARGDQLLVQIGELLRRRSAPGELVARVGADEFAVVTRAADESAALARARELRALVSTTYELAGLTFDVGLSVGVAVAPEHAADADTLMRRVDVALSNTKHTGRQVSLYDPTMDQASLYRLRLVTQLREALDAGHVVVRYQPKVSLRTRELAGVEALVRWEHPEYGEVVPDQFVPLAEVTGLVGPLTMHVLRLAMEQCGRWLDRDLRIPVAVNLSARNLLDTEFPDKVAELLRFAKVPTDMLTFELTESSVMTDPDRMKPVLRRLHEMGVGLSIDDFGTGYSSLSQLRRLPVDEVKIDKVFVLSMGTDLGDMAIVRAIVELGHSLGLRVVAEGVEDELTRDLLAGNECDVIQGFLVSRALDPERLDAWFAARTTTRPGQPGVQGRRLEMIGS